MRKKAKQKVVKETTLCEEIYALAKSLNPLAQYRTTTNRYEEVSLYPKNSFGEKIVVRTSVSQDQRIQIEMLRVANGDSVWHVQCFSNSKQTTNAAITLIKSELKRLC